MQSVRQFGFSSSNQLPRYYSSVIYNTAKHVSLSQEKSYRFQEADEGNLSLKMGEGFSIKLVII